MSSEALSLVLESIFKQPTPEALSKLQPLLLAIDHPAAESAHEIAGQFYLYLSGIRNMITARQFPVVATALSVTATGMGVAEDILSEGPTNLLRVMIDSLRVALDTLSTYQFVRQWEPTFASLHDTASWSLYRSYWKLSVDTQPELDTLKRAELLENLFSIVRDSNSDTSLRLALLVRLFQWGLMSRLVPLIELTKQQV